MIDITLLGTAALMPIPERALTAAVMECGGHSILFDCGEGTQTAARRAGVSLFRTDIIALTHYHGDHIFGLPGLLQSLGSLGRTKPLTILGPEGIHDTLDPILKLTGWVNFDVRLVEAGQEPIPLSTFAEGWPREAALTPFPTAHRVPSLGYALTLDRAGRFLPEKARALDIPVTMWGILQRGESVQCPDGRVIEPEQVLGGPRRGLKAVFTGDTAYCPTLVRGEENADLVISEATYAADEQETLAYEHGHMTFALAARAAREEGAKRLWLTHFSQMVDNAEAYLPNAAKAFPPTACGFDGMRLTLRFS